jgi:CRP/FNR family transcriptional regulator, cyclic AMP receptor protein
MSSFVTLPFDLTELLSLGQARSYRAQAIIMREGDPGRDFYVLLSGSVRSFGQDATGREITFNTIGAGEYFGEMSMDGGVRSANVMAIEACECLVIPMPLVWGYAQRHNPFALDLVQTMIRRTRAATLVARDLALSDVYSRLAATLQRLGGVSALITPKPTHAQLAAMIGASREMVSKLLKDLERGGYVQASTAAISLLKPLPKRW